MEVEGGMAGDKETLNFLFEMGMLKRIKHEGWRVAGVEQPDSVADHALRATQVAYFLARAEDHSEPWKPVLMVVFHDMPEARVGDVHRVARRYIEADEVSAAKEQTAPLGEVGGEVLALWQEFEAEETNAAQIAKDADRLEQALTAKEYMERGYPFAKNWIDNIRKVLYTETALRWLEAILEMDSHDWWQNLKELDPARRH